MRSPYEVSLRNGVVKSIEWRVVVYVCGVPSTVAQMRCAPSSVRTQGGLRRLGFEGLKDVCHSVDELARGSNVVLVVQNYRRASCSARILKSGIWRASATLYMDYSDFLPTFLQFIAGFDFA